MHKEELISLHKIMSEIKDFFEKNNNDNTFSDYYALNVDPSHIHKSKMEHKHAIFILGQAIADSMKEVDFSATGRISARMSELAQKTQKEMEYFH